MSSGPEAPKPLTLSPGGKSQDVLGKTLFKLFEKCAETQETQEHEEGGGVAEEMVMVMVLLKNCLVL